MIHKCFLLRPKAKCAEATSLHIFLCNFEVNCCLFCRHVLPEELGVQNINTESESVDLLQSGHAVILYMHGNAGTR